MLLLLGFFGATARRAAAAAVAATISPLPPQVSSPNLCVMIRREVESKAMRSRQEGQGTVACLDVPFPLVAFADRFSAASASCLAVDSVALLFCAAVFLEGFARRFFATPWF
jgi:hypothetical protein